MAAVAETPYPETMEVMPPTSSRPSAGDPLGSRGEISGCESDAPLGGKRQKAVAPPLGDRVADPPAMHHGRGEAEGVRDCGRAVQSVDDFTSGSHNPDIALSGSLLQARIMPLGIEIARGVPQKACMLSNAELLERLSQAGVKKKAIAEALGINASRITEMYDGGRPLKLDEARVLVEKFGLDTPEAAALTLPIARLLALHVARKVKADFDPRSPLVEELALDLVAFSRFALDPRHRESVDAVGGFFQALRILSQSQDQTGGSQGSNPAGKGGTNDRN